MFRIVRWICRKLYHCELVPALSPPDRAAIGYLIWVQTDGTRTTLKLDPNVKSDPGLVAIGRDVEDEVTRLLQPPF